MKHFLKRATAMLLVAVMLVMMVPAGMISVGAETDYGVPQTGHKLLYSYNALTGTDISSGEADIVTSLDIFNRDKLGELLHSYASYTGMHTQFGELHQGRDLFEFSNSAGFSISKSLGANIGIEKLFKASAQRKFTLTGNLDYSKSVETYFYDYTVNVQKGYYTFNTNSALNSIRDLSSGYLEDAFLKALTGEDGSTPEEVFERYGTHIITAYTAGGTAGVYSESYGETEKLKVDLAGKYSKSIGASATAQGIGLGLNKVFDIHAEVAGSSTSEGYESTCHSYALGGNDAVDFKKDEFHFEEWVDSLTAENATILVDKRLRFIPIWELLPSVGYEARIADLLDWFIERSEAADNAFYDQYGIDKDMFDYSEDWLGFDNCKIITNEEELNAIRNDLGGVYVLANDIALSKYADWEPIGTKAEPFTGRLYGNYNTISGLSMVVDQFEDNGKDQLFGLFGCSSGLVSDVKLSGSISVLPHLQPNVYVGAFVAYNNGIVNNCYDDVNYNVLHDGMDDVNLPVVAQEITVGTHTLDDDDIGIYLVGQEGTTYNNTNIVITGNNNESPVYIILENVDMCGDSSNGTIYNETTRPVYLISEGTANVVRGVNGAPGAPAINTINSFLHIFGDADLNICGGNGTIGGTGNNSKGSRAGTGGTGYAGGTGVQTAELTVSLSQESNLAICGGSGGQGGDGGYGESGPIAGNGYGGHGGTGGVGSFAICAGRVNFLSGNITIVGGSGGTGGTGGYGEKQGWDSGYGGNGGTGGNGALALPRETVVAYKNVIMYQIGGLGGSGGSAGYGNGRGYANSGSGGSSGAPRADVYLGNKRYTLYDETKLWANAKVAAEEKGGYLATITSADEQALIEELLAYGTQESYFLGGYRTVNDINDWAWVTGEPFEYTNWGVGEPNNGNNKDEDSVGIFRGTKLWNDYPDNAYGYIVECDGSNDDYAIITKSILSGIGVAYNANRGKLKNINHTQWKNKLLKIDAVKKTNYFSTNKLFKDVFEPDTIICNLNGSPDIQITASGSFSSPGIAAVRLEESNGYTRLVPIYIKETIPSDLKIKTMPKQNYELREPFDISTLVLDVYYNDGSIRENVGINDSDLKYTRPDMTQLGKKTITITYLNESITYDITVEKITVSGKIKIIGTPEVNNTLSAQIITISPEDGRNSLSYHWYVDGSERATGQTFNVTDSMAGKRISLMATGFGNYRGELEDSIDIRKKEQNAPSAPPTVKSITATTVTLEAVAGMEYTYCSGDVLSPSEDSEWQSSSVFEGLRPNSTYSFFSRYRETPTATVSVASGAVVVTTAKIDIAGTVTIPSSAKVGETLTATVSGLAPGATVEYLWYRDGVAIASATGSSYKLGEADADTKIYVVVRGIGTYTGEIRSNTVNVQANVIDLNAARVEVKTKTTTAGNKVKVDILMHNNPGIANVQLKIAYNTTVLTLVEVTDGGILGVQMHSNNLDSPYNLVWANDTLEENITANGTIATLVFDVAEDAPDGEYPISVSYDYDNYDIYDWQLKPVKFETVNGGVNVTPFMIGDVDNNGVVNNLDRTILARFLAKWTGYTESSINMLASDVNDDGVVNNLDRTILARYLAKWTGYDSLPYAK